MPKQHVVSLTAEQRRELAAALDRNATTALEQRRARMLLHADAGVGGPRRSDREVAAAVGVDPRTVARVRMLFATEGLAVALRGHPRQRQTPPKLDGAQEVRLVALACAAPPAGRTRWTLRLLAERAVALEVVEAVSHETVRQTLKKTSSSRG